MAGLSSENKLRDVFNSNIVESFAQRLKESWIEFNSDAFVSSIIPSLSSLGFIERSNLIRDKLGEFLPEEFPKAADILIQALGPELKNPGETAWESFIVMPQCAFVSKFGGNHYEASMKALYEMTKRFSAEGDLRTFLELDYDRTMKMLHDRCKDPSPHVRRLVSEGTRPRLPLAGRIKRFQKDPRPMIELLEKLRTDPELYVRRSVANNINDIAKDNPNIAVDTLIQWRKDSNPHSQWVVKHAARSLIKKGNRGVFKLLGYRCPPPISVTSTQLNQSKIRIGDSLGFSFTIKSKSEKVEPLIIDYVVHYQKAKGRLSEKVFKCREVKIKAGETLKISTNHPFKNVSTRTIYPGLHKIEFQVNGKRFGGTRFTVF